MIQWRGTFGLLVAGTLLSGLACEDQTPVIKVPDEPAKEVETKPARPTTQSLLEGPRKTVPLKLLPFTIEAPEGWEVTVKGNRDRDTTSVTMLEGPIINDTVAIRLFLRESVSSNILQLWIDKVAKEDAEYRKAGGSVTTRDLGDLRLIDRRRLPAAATQPASTQPSDSPVEWRITIFHPSGIKYDQYELSFFFLSPESFRANEKFLDSILSTIKYNDAGMPPMP